MRRTQKLMANALLLVRLKLKAYKSNNFFNCDFRMIFFIHGIFKQIRRTHR